MATRLKVLSILAICLILFLRLDGLRSFPRADRRHADVMMFRFAPHYRPSPAESWIISARRGLLMPDIRRRESRGRWVRKHFPRCRGTILLYLLLSGDVELNPRPKYKYPCVRCKKPVRRCQKGIQCDSCDLWCHTTCAQVSDDVYSKLAACNDSWSCIKCTFLELPFPNPVPINPVSPMAERNTNDGDADMNGVNDRDSVYSPLEDSTNQTILCHLNAQSLMNKMDELHSPHRCQQTCRVRGK